MDRLNVPFVQLISKTKHWYLDLDPDWTVEFEVLWSPDSQFVALTGNPNGYTESVRVFHLTESGPVSLDVARAPFADMMHRFPPCLASHANPDLCEEIANSDEDINFAAVGWTGEHTIVMMAEIPPTGDYGGILGQVMGYEVELPGGRILQSLTAREFKRKWQRVMAWNFSIPEPPEWQN